MTNTEQLASRLAAVPLFRGCSRSDLRVVARHIDVAQAGVGVELVTQGEIGEVLYILLDGEARVDRDGVPVGVVQPGDYFGELALLDPAPRAATVTTTEPSVVAALSLRMFKLLLRSLPSISAELLADLAHRARELGGDRSDRGPLET